MCVGTLPVYAGSREKEKSKKEKQKHKNLRDKCGGMMKPILSKKSRCLCLRLGGGCIPGLSNDNLFPGFQLFPVHPGSLPGSPGLHCPWLYGFLVGPLWVALLLCILLCIDFCCLYQLWRNALLGIPCSTKQLVGDTHPRE